MQSKLQSHDDRDDKDSASGDGWLRTGEDQLLDLNGQKGPPQDQADTRSAGGGS